jgi:TorA maturation chaperone TorD
LTRGELLPFASYYLTGFLNEKPLARLRADMQALGIERVPDVYALRNFFR